MKRNAVSARRLTRRAGSPFSDSRVILLAKSSFLRIDTLARPPGSTRWRRAYIRCGYTLHGKRVYIFRGKFAAVNFYPVNFTKMTFSYTLSYLPRSGAHQCLVWVPYSRNYFPGKQLKDLKGWFPLTRFWLRTLTHLNFKHVKKMETR